MRSSNGVLTLLRGALAVLVAGWLAAGSCHVSYSSCNHDADDCSAPKHDRHCPCFDGSSIGAGAGPSAVPARAIAFEVEVDALGRAHVRRWLVTGRGPVALDRPSAGGGPSGARAPFATP